MLLSFPKIIELSLNVQLTVLSYVQSYLGWEKQPRVRRQAETTEAPEGSGEPVELLVEQPKTGASLGEILGEEVLKSFQ